MRALLLLVILCAFSYCSSSLKVRSTRDRSVNFNQYTTFDFFEIQGDHLKLKEVNRRRLAMAIELELGMKGIKRNNDNPDLLVNVYSTIHKREVHASQATGGVGYYGMASPFGTGVGVSVGSGQKAGVYTSGMISIDLVDRARSALVMESIINFEGGDRDDAERMINYATRKAFKDIPDKVKR